MLPADDDEAVAKCALRHSISEEAARAILLSLRQSGGAMAQFNHPELGGMGQWSRGMTMIGDMFNDRLRAKVEALAADLSEYVRTCPSDARIEPDVSYHASSKLAGSWWPAELGQPSSVGGQDNLRYAIFRSAGRLAIDDAGRLSVYDTADHIINGISQSQAGDATLTLHSQHGIIHVSDLRRV